MEAELNIRNLELNAHWSHFIPWKTQKIQFLGISYLVEIENIQNMSLMNKSPKMKRGENNRTQTLQLLGKVMVDEIVCSLSI